MTTRKTATDAVTFIAHFVHSSEKIIYRVPTRTWENGKVFSRRGILNRLGESCKILEMSGNFRQMLFIIFSYATANPSCMFLCVE